MAEPGPPTTAPESAPTPAAAPGRSKDEIALELLKFVTATTGFTKGMPGAGFSAKSTPRSPEEQVDALLELFERCRQAVRKED